MPKPRKIPLKIQSGVLKDESEYSSQGRWIDTNWVRFVDDKVEKIGGWETVNPDEPFNGIARAMLCWDDYDLRHWHAVGTTIELDVYTNDSTRTDITPVVESGTLTNPFSTTNASAVVTVADTGHGRSVGDGVIFDGATAVGGITVDGFYTVTSVIDANSYRITHSAAATSSAGPGGGSVDYEYLLPVGETSLTIGGGGAYGEGVYGGGPYGVGEGGTQIILPRTWSLDQYGENLLALPSGWPVYEWDPDTPTDRATLLANSPTGLFMFVTSERIIVVLGADGDLMTLHWSDDEDPTVWTPASGNTATIRKLQSGSRLVAGCRLSEGVNLIWSDSSLYVMQYTGVENIVYDTRLVDDKCGLIGPHAFTVVNGVAYWMSGNDFYYFNGSVNQIPRTADLRTFFFANINREQAIKTACGYNPHKNEIWWTYTSIGRLENRSYVAVNNKVWDWIQHDIPRAKVFSSWSQAHSITNDVHVSDLDGNILHLEHGTDDDTHNIPWSCETGYMDIDEGNTLLNIMGFVPDFQTQVGEVRLKLASKDHPMQSALTEQREYSIFEGNDIIDIRHSGRQVKLRFAGGFDRGDTFRMGLPTVEVSPAGKRR